MWKAELDAGKTERNYERATKRARDVNITLRDFFRSCSKILEMEMIITEPTHIVFFSDEYRDIINEITFGYNSDEIEVLESCDRLFTSKRTQKSKIYPWKVKRFSNQEKTMYVLITRHPQGTYSEFEEAIKEWIDKTNS